MLRMIEEYESSRALLLDRAHEITERLREPVTSVERNDLQLRLRLLYEESVEMKRIITILRERLGLSTECTDARRKEYKHPSPHISEDGRRRS